MNMVSISEDEFKTISGFVYDKFGIKLGEQKKTLIIERLQKILRTGGFSSFGQYFDYIIKEPTGEAVLTFIDKVSTHHTFFFRENDHFDYLNNSALPHLLEKCKSSGEGVDIRIWCAGCSSGEEPYTVAMCVNEFIENNRLRASDISILATDISVTSIEKATGGIYQAPSLAHVPPMFRQKYFTASGDGNFILKPFLRDKVLFRRLNLMRDDYPFKGKFDIIFCRNVMIYFDAPTRASLIGRFHRYTRDGGYLFIGHSESISRTTLIYKYIKPAVYQKA
ncbi:MAG: Chemotaxis protein methyltransferase Cher2 [bacterium ADurb.Bin243]|nr:MAG: Chemotaxis protein methyltransferase Cher2 [bacterium ADurb.Bin243]